MLGLFIWFILWLFSPGKEPDVPTEQPIDTPTQVEQFDAVRYVQDGQITAQEQHYSVQITIDSGSRRIDVMQGYNGNIIRSQSYSNTIASYDAFYAAINNVGFFVKRENANGADRVGVCPFGIRYSYQAGSPISELSLDTWGSSCGTKTGTFGGNASQVKTLFKEQIPDYSTITKDISL